MVFVLLSTSPFSRHTKRKQNLTRDSGKGEDAGRNDGAGEEGSGGGKEEEEEEEEGRIS